MANPVLGTPVGWAVGNAVTGAAFTLGITPSTTGNYLLCWGSQWVANNATVTPTVTVSDNVDGAWTVINFGPTPGVGGSITNGVWFAYKQASSTAARTVTVTQTSSYGANWYYAANAVEASNCSGVDVSTGQAGAVNTASITFSPGITTTVVDDLVLAIWANFETSPTAFTSPTSPWAAVATHLVNGDMTNGLFSTPGGASGSTFAPTITTNGTGPETGSGLLIALKPITGPTITVQPTNQSALVGQTATFSVTATGATGYQWKLGGTPIGGATSSSYTTGTLVAGDNGGLYLVDCSNGSGTTTSNTVRLLVSASGNGTLGQWDPSLRILGWF